MAASAPETSRRHPARVRKRNRLFFDDDEDVVPVAKPSPKKACRQASPVSAPTNDKKAAQLIGMRLRNLLKLPKAHKWVCYEFFYSNIDCALFEGDNDFCICISESFPHLKTKVMKRAEWCKIRRLMGKPRRCSPAFFSEERSALGNKRNKIRLLQQRKVFDLQMFKDLPREIPLPLVIGTKVTARLRKPQDGLFTGSIAAVDTYNASYRVTFDRQGLGTHSIPDFEVQSCEIQETMPITSFSRKQRPRSLYSGPKFLAGLSSPGMDHDPTLSDASMKNRILGMENETLGGFPVKFLVLIVRLSKILDVKKDKIRMLKDMNTQAERMKSYMDPITIDFQRKYASIVLDLEKLNRDLNEYLVQVQQYCQEIAPEQGITPSVSLLPTRNRCDDEARVIAEKAESSRKKSGVKDERLNELITQLTSLMLQIKNFTDGDSNTCELKDLGESLTDIKSGLDPSNVRCFQDNVEIHVKLIQSGLSQLGNLHAFSTQQIQEFS